MAKNITGKTSSTKESLLIDAGAWFKNFIVGVDTYESALAAGKCLGATQGGGNFTATPEVREIPIDGADPIPIYDGWNVTMQANMLEVKPGTLMLALGTGTLADAPGAMADNYYLIRAKRQIDTSTDYIENITWVGTLSGSNEPVIIQIFNTISTAGINMNMAPKANGILSVTFTSSPDIDKMQDAVDYAPFAIYYPKSIAMVVLDPVTSEDTAISGKGTVGATVFVSGGTIPGGKLFAMVINCLGHERAEQPIVNLLASIGEVKPEEILQQPISETFTLLKEIGRENDITTFFAGAASLAK